MAKSTGERGEALRQRIEEQMAKAEKERQDRLFQARLNLVREAMVLYHRKKFAEATNKFKSYLKTLEDYKGVSEGELHPKHFDKEKDLTELLMITAVYWDLVKLYDRTKDPVKQKEFSHYMHKYQIFSKGMPFETVTAESLRKYIYNNKPVHKDLFKQAYKNLGGKDCFVVTAVSDYGDPLTIPTLRVFREVVLRKSTFGRAFIGIYNFIGPHLAQLVLNFPHLIRRRLALVFDRLAHRVLLRLTISTVSRSERDGS